MKKRLAITTCLVFMSSAAFGGLFQPLSVTVDLTTGFAQGDLTAAANSSNDVEYIGCGSRNIDAGTGFPFRFGFCQATDADGVTAICTTENPVLIDEIRGIDGRSYVTFSWTEDASGNLTCTRIGFSTQSFYLDKIK